MPSFIYEGLHRSCRDGAEVKRIAQESALYYYGTPSTGEAPQGGVELNLVPIWHKNGSLRLLHRDQARPTARKQESA
jgi:hypothetical protein